MYLREKISPYKVVLIKFPIMLRSPLRKFRPCFVPDCFGHVTFSCPDIYPMCIFSHRKEAFFDFLEGSGRWHRNITGNRTNILPYDQHVYTQPKPSLFFPFALEFRLPKTSASDESVCPQFQGLLYRGAFFRFVARCAGSFRPPR